jgi:hypothetical protein
VYINIVSFSDCFDLIYVKNRPNYKITKNKMNKQINVLLNAIKRHSTINQIRKTSNVVESTTTSAENLDFGKCLPKRMHKMQGYSISAYSSDLEELQFSNTLRKPVISTPSQVLVKVTASSVNPIDVAMMSELFIELLIYSAIY